MIFLFTSFLINYSNGSAGLVEMYPQCGNYCMNPNPCGWTDKWTCPGAKAKRGAIGTAQPVGGIDIGFFCCCVAPINDFDRLTCGQREKFDKDGKLTGHWLMHHIAPRGYFKKVYPISPKFQWNGNNASAIALFMNNPKLKTIDAISKEMKKEVDTLINIRDKLGGEMTVLCDSNIYPDWINEKFKFDPTKYFDSCAIWHLKQQNIWFINNDCQGIPMKFVCTTYKIQKGWPHGKQKHEENFAKPQTINQAVKYYGQLKKIQSKNFIAEDFQYLVDNNFNVFICDPKQTPDTISNFQWQVNISINRIISYLKLWSNKTS